MQQAPKTPTLSNVAAWHDDGRAAVIEGTGLAVTQSLLVSGIGLVFLGGADPEP